MNDENYPALYVAANNASIEAQETLLRTHRLNSLLLIVAAALALFSQESKIFAILSAIVFLASLLLYIYGNQKQFQAKWYQARALAESIKTATWRFMMGADPFSDGQQQDDPELFRRLLNELLIENKGIGEYLSGEWAERDQITEYMLETKKSNYNIKRDFYLVHRIDEQRSWYARKSGINRKASKKWYKIICGLYGISILLVLCRVAWSGLSYLPIEVFAVSASTVIGWTQIKRFDELSSAYGLTAHEIGIVKSRYTSVNCLASLAKFVSDAENAFSREHTQWAARRDH